MPFFMQCPFCKEKFNLPYTVVVIGCPLCGKTFLVDHLSEGFSWESSSRPAAEGPTVQPPLQTFPAELLEPMPVSEQPANPPVGEDGIQPASKTPSIPELPEPMPMFAEALDPPLTEDEVNAFGKTGPVPELPEPMPMFLDIPDPPVSENAIQPASGSDPVPELPEPVAIFVKTAEPPVKAMDQTRPAPKSNRPAPVPQAIPSDGDEEEESTLLDWVSPWALVAFMLAVSALLLASVVGVRILTITLSALGLVAIGAGIWTSSESPTKVWLSLTLGGTMNVVLLLLAFFVPGVINSRWAMDFSVPASDPNKRVVVPRDEPRHNGRPLSEEEWVDAVKEGIRQDEMFIRVESVLLDRLGDQGHNKYLQVHLRLGHAGHGKTITVAGFSREMNLPLLTDDAGRQVRFVEQRLRKQSRGRGPLVFEISGPHVRELGATGFLDVLLVFEAPAAKVEGLNLEVPASAWDRIGVCRFRCPGLFNARADFKKGKP